MPAIVFCLWKMASCIYHQYPCFMAVIYVEATMIDQQTYYV